MSNNKFICGFVKYVSAILQNIHQRELCEKIAELFMFNYPNRRLVTDGLKTYVADKFEQCNTE